MADWTYKKAGVDIEKESEAISSIADVLKETFKNQPGKVLADIGTFANLIELGDKALVLCTDGVGTKVLLAQKFDKYDTVGIDLIAMNVNDAICLGAEPIALVDYLAMEKPDPKMMAEIGKGLAKGAEQAGIAIIGGETATLPEMIKGEPGKGFDLAGTCLAVVVKNKIITGEKIQAGDILIGLLSSGIHSNGLTLARKVLAEDEHLLKELLTPTKIYVKQILNLLKQVEVKGLAHMTGGGLLNLKRLNKNIGFEITNWPEIPNIFTEIQSRGNVEEAEMYRTFNMGIGFCVVVSEQNKDKTMEILEGAVELGKAVEGNKIKLKDLII